MNFEIHISSEINPMMNKSYNIEGKVRLMERRRGGEERRRRGEEVTAKI